MVPLVAMLRHASYLGRTDLLRLAVSARTLADLPFAEQLTAGGALIATTARAGAHRIAPLVG